jgi:hypothetical protein
MMDARIILAGQQPDMVNILARSNEAAQQRVGFDRQNALARMYQEQGPGIAAGDQGALNALARFDPQAALGVQEARQGMQATQQGMDILSREEQRQVQEAAASMTAAQRAAEAQKIEDGVKMGLAARSPQEWDAMMQQVAPELVGQFGQREGLANRFMSIADIMKRQEPPKPQSALGKFEADRAAGFVPTDAEFKGDGPTVNVNTGEGSKFYDELDKGQAGMFQTLMDEGVQAGRTLQQIGRLGQILQSTPTGAGAAFQTMLGEYGIPTQGLDNLQAAQALINQIVPQQRQPGSGPMSDADLALFKQSVPRLINQPNGNQIIVERMRGIAQYQIEQARIASAVANRQISPAQGREALAALANPLEGIAGGGDQGRTVIVDGRTQTEGAAETGNDLTPEERSYLGLP